MKNKIGVNVFLLFNFFLSLASAENLWDKATHVICESQLNEAQNLLGKAINTFDVPIKGLIQLGAHEGEECHLFSRYGFKKVLLIEADPDTFVRLQKLVQDNYPSFETVQFAATNKQGNFPFHRTTFSQSNSTKLLKKHLWLFPEIHQAEQIMVQNDTLDHWLESKKLSHEFNVLVMDIQGGEIDALKGSLKTLRDIDAIVTEVNYDELYEGGGQLVDLDKFLMEQGFIRVDTITAAKGYGDSLYVKKKFLAV